MSIGTMSEISALRARKELWATNFLGLISKRATPPSVPLVKAMIPAIPKGMVRIKRMAVTQRRGFPADRNLWMGLSGSKM
jgi:hypothetical protein